MKSKAEKVIKQNNNTTRIFLISGLILLVPFIAMQVTDEVVWDLADFIIAGSLILGTGFAYERLATRVSKKYRTLVGIALIIALILIWAELAVGLFGTPVAGS